MANRSPPVVTTPVEQLDPQSVAYLRAVEAGSGAGHPGIFTWQSGGWFAGPRGGWWLMLGVGIALFGVLGLVCWNIAPQAVGAEILPVVQAVLAGLGTLFLLLGIIRFLRAKPHWLPKSFLFADASFLWQVTPNQITATPLLHLAKVDGTHYSNNGSYTHSNIQMRFTDGYHAATLHGKRLTENLIGFFQYLIAFRNSDHDYVRDWAAASPGRLGAAAARFVARGPDAGLNDLPDTADPPVPYPVPPDPSAPRYGWGGALVCFFVAIGVGVGGAFGFSLMNNYLQDEYLFAQIPAQDNGGLGPIDAYLSAFPNGRHATTAREMLDDRRFAHAKQDAKNNRSPGSLRAYLADSSNQRHRPDAVVLIADYYDEAINELKTKQAKQEEPVDKKLFDGFIALLEALKLTDRPVVTVGFKAELDPAPVTKDQKEREKFRYDLYLEKTPELKAIADRSLSKSAIMDHGQAFDPGATDRREGVILDRLRAAIRKGINADIITLEPAAKGQAPMMEVGYHVFADGNLGTYTGMDKHLVGLLRWYSISWTITIRPPGAEQALFVYTIQSEPGAKLTYDSEPSDPSWAIYAVLLYSGFYDMSARLIRNFGLDPGVVPNAFSFAAATRNEPDKPDVPDDPFKNFPPPDFPGMPIKPKFK